MACIVWPKRLHSRPVKFHHHFFATTNHQQFRGGHWSVGCVHCQTRIPVAMQRLITITGPRSTTDRQTSSSEWCWCLWCLSPIISCDHDRELNILRVLWTWSSNKKYDPTNYTWSITLTEIWVFHYCGQIFSICLTWIAPILILSFPLSPSKNNVILSLSVHRSFVLSCRTRHI